MKLPISEADFCPVQYARNLHVKARLRGDTLSLTNLRSLAKRDQKNFGVPEFPEQRVAGGTSERQPLCRIVAEQPVEEIVDEGRGLNLPERREERQRLGGGGGTVNFCTPSCLS